MTRTWAYLHRACVLCGKVLRDGDGNYVSEHKSYDWLHVCLDCNEKYPSIRRTYNGTIDRNHPLNPRNDPTQNSLRRKSITQLDVVTVMGWDKVDVDCVCERLDIPTDDHNRDRIKKTLRRMEKAGLVEVAMEIEVENIREDRGGRKRIARTWRRI